MTSQVRTAMVTAVLSLLVALPALGQPAAVSASDPLVNRLKQVESDPAQLETIRRTGRRVAGFCANCHGDGGNSVKPDVPNLAGQNSFYLLEQVRQLGDGKRTTTEFKRRLIKVMTVDEKVGMTAFYAGQPVTPKPPVDAALVKRGGELYDAKCAECHEFDGRGTKKYARIAGQQTVYLSTTLKGYRDGTGARMKRQMEKELKTMNDADIAALVAFVSSMK